MHLTTTIHKNFNVYNKLDSDMLFKSLHSFQTLINTLCTLFGSLCQASNISSMYAEELPFMKDSVCAAVVYFLPWPCPPAADADDVA